MNKLKRLLIQAVLWLVIGIIIWLNQDATQDILTENLVAFAFQISLIGGLIYYAGPQLLFKQKYVLFAILSVLAIVVSSYILSNLFGLPIEGPRPLNEMGLRPPPHELRKPPSKFLMHILMLSVSYILAIVIEGFIYLKTKEEETIKNRNENLQTELKLLKSQINPHFLFNSLNNIYALSAIDSEKTQQSISYLSDMLRYVLYECEQEVVPLKKEIDYIKNYLKLYSLKSSKNYPITTEFNILNNTVSIAPMLFIPFIENALKHSDIEKIKDSFISIKIDADADEISFKIENSIPKKAINKDEVGGIGVENVKKRLAILYPKRHQLTISENKTTFKVELNIKQA